MAQRIFSGQPCSVSKPQHSTACSTISRPDLPLLLQAVQGDLFDVAGAAADPAMDMWAVGAMAFEIFTGRAYFSRQAHSDSDVISMLLGFEPLPSESQAAFWHRIREPAAQRLVQNLLRRVPGQRSTINEVCCYSSHPLHCSNVFQICGDRHRIGQPVAQV